jgi:bifunctional DNA-binding transcriptional regulator/antitoxin component of YhaV-PrlF toxin-antitoxin module
MSMKATFISRMSERGQVSVPISIRNALGLTPSSRIAWTLDAETGTATLSPIRAPQKGGAQAALGFAARFRKTRRTADWLRGVDDTGLEDLQGGTKR